jgi:hypothetical protein
MDFEPPPSQIPGSPEPEPTPEFFVEGTEPAWERKQELGFVKAYTETVKQVLLKPSETFERLFVGGGFVNPLIFAIIGGWAVAIVGAIFSTLFGGMLAGMASSGGASNSEAAMQLLGQAFGGWFAAIFAPIGVALVCFVLAGCYHVGLMMLGGMRGNYETTFRVVAYSYGASVVLGLIPVCGGTVGAVWGIVCTIIGLSRAHQVETWKGVVAWLITFVICCGIIGGFYALFFGAIMAAAGAASGGGITTP